MKLGSICAAGTEAFTVTHVDKLVFTVCLEVNALIYIHLAMKNIQLHLRQSCRSLAVYISGDGFISGLGLGLVLCPSFVMPPSGFSMDSYRGVVNSR